MKATYIGNINPNPEYNIYLGTAMPYGTSKYVPPIPKWWEQYGEIAEYVISNGTDNYLRLGVNTQNDIIVETKMSYLSLATQSGFGGITGTGSTRNVVEGASYTGTVPFWGYTSVGKWTTMDSVPIAIGQDLDYRFEYSSGDQKVYLNGSLVSTGNQVVDIVNPTEMYLFARNFGNALNVPTMGKWYRFRAEKPDGTALTDLQPFYITKKAMTDRAGRVHPIGSFVMIDNVTEDVPAIYGELLDGRSKQPADYIFLDRVRNTGSAFVTQAVNLKYEFDMSCAYTASGIKIPHGSGTSGGHYLGVQNSFYSLGGGRQSTDTCAERKTVILDNTGAPGTPCKLTVDGNVTERPSTFPATSPLILFSDTANSLSSYKVESDLYSNGVKAYNKDGSLAYHWRAIKVILTGEITMIDTLTGIKLKNTGTDDLIELSLEGSIMTLNEIGISHTSDMNENIKILNEMGVK